MVESDEEQVEVLKKWWDENGTSLIVTLVLVLGGTFGYRAWENSVIESGEAASVVYEDLVTSVRSITGEDDDPMKHSEFSDGKWGWADLAIRPQETIERWEGYGVAAGEDDAPK